MKDEVTKLDKALSCIERNVEREIDSSIGRVIGRIFDITERILAKLLDKIKDKYADWKIRKTMHFTLNSQYLRAFLIRKKVDMILFVTHNGDHFEGKYIKKKFYELQETNDLLKCLLKYSIEIDEFDDWIENCKKGVDIYVDNFDEKLQSYFGEFGYTSICFRKYRGGFYLLLCSEKMPTDKDEFYITQQVDRLLK